MKEHFDNKMDSLHNKVDKKFRHYHEYHEMVAKNQSWKYSAAVYPKDVFSEDHYHDDAYNEYDAECIVECAELLKDATIK